MATMCDKELLLGYLYDELPPSGRQAFDRHLASCAACRDEVSGLRGTRAHLASWAPPEPDLGFEVVRSARPARGAAPERWWRLSPAWGLAAAALLTVAVSAAIAHVEVTFGGDGVVVRTGWNRGVQAAGQVPAAAAAAASTSQVQRLEARLKELEGQLAPRQAAAVPAGVARMTDAEIVRYIRQQVSDSEQRQQGLLADKILQVNRDTELARRADMDRLLVAYRQLQGTNFETFQRTKALEEHFMRVGLQR